jgi:AcrR family transcriptional regulator
MTRKEREKLLRKREITYAASRLFAEKGFIHTTLDEIADAAEFGKGTLYNYFENKDELYLYIIERIFEDYFNLIKQSYDATDSIKDFLSQLTLKIFEYCIENRYSVLLIVRVRTQIYENEILEKSDLIKNIQGEVHKLYKRRISVAVKNKEILDVDPESLIALYSSMIFPYLHVLMHCRKDNSIDIKAESDFVLNIFFNGVLTNKSR